MDTKKKKSPVRLPALLSLLSAFSFLSLAHAATAATDFLANDPNATNQLIVRLRPHTLATQSIHNRVSQLAGASLTYHRAMGNGALVYQMPAHTPVTYVRQMAAKITGDPNVLYAEPNVKRQLIRSLLSKTAATTRRISLAAPPNDPLYSQQWSLSGATGSINAPAAWQVTTGSSSIITAIVDSGARFDHEDLQGRLIAGANFTEQNMNPVDPGANDQGMITYHGTWIAGIIGAATNNGLGLAGINWVSKMLVVRVTDNTGATTLANEVDGMRWAAGIPVPGFPNNPTPAKIINFSSGGPGACTQTEIEAINEIRAKGAVVVVAAGNDGVDASNTAPANCPGVIAVTAIDTNASRPSWGNYGTSVTISAPGVNIALTGSETRPPKTNDYIAADGTSFAAPMVSGVISLMLSANPGLSPDKVASLLKQSARAFPNGVDCSGVCQAGMLDAGQAVALASGQQPSSSNPPSTSQPQTLHVLISRAQTVSAGARVQLIGIGNTTPDAHISSYQWNQVGGPAVKLSNTRVSQPSFIAPRTAATLTFHLTVTDNLGRTAGASTQIGVSNPAGSPAP